jgi:hypothetical protein
VTVDRDRHNLDVFAGYVRPNVLIVCRRPLMILREIVHTCSNANVARAALASIGGDFAKHFAADASRRNMPAGVLAASMVKEFSANADDEEWDGVDEAVRGADQPILSGLRYILSQGLRDRDTKSRAQDGDRGAPWIRGAAPGHACCA